MNNLLRCGALSRRKVKTLKTWWKQLNNYEWPEEIEVLTMRPKPTCSDLYVQIMQEIQAELGRRVLFGKLKN